MADFYCEYCGSKYSSVAGLTSGTCLRHPEGFGEGTHKLYEGSVKSQYTCKYCGNRNSSIQGLTSGTCHRHPDGSGKGRHSPAL